MRLLALVLLSVGLLACSGAPPMCKCGTGTACVFVGADTASRCVQACDLDAGSCPGGTTCTCAASCQGCKDCVRVCQ